VTTATLTRTPPDDARFERQLSIECVHSVGTPNWRVIPIGSRAASSAVALTMAAGT
jgi:hypothetical protein